MASLAAHPKKKKSLDIFRFSPLVILAAWLWHQQQQENNGDSVRTINPRIQTPPLISPSTHSGPPSRLTDSPPPISRSLALDLDRQSWANGQRVLVQEKQQQWAEGDNYVTGMWLQPLAYCHGVPQGPCSHERADDWNLSQYSCHCSWKVLPLNFYR